MKVYSILFIVLALLFSGCSSTPEKPVDTDLTVLFCGDVMLDWGIKNILKTQGYQYPFLPIKEFLASFDYRIINLECPITAKGAPHPFKKYVFKAPPEALNVLLFGGIDGVSLANNHSNDFGNEALVDTMALLAKAGIQYTGAGVEMEHAHLPILLTKNDIRIAIFGYTNIGYPNSYAGKNSPGIANINLRQIQKDMNKFKSFLDFIIVTIHWGDEYSEFPSKKQRIMAHKIIDSGADAIIGHHPHIYQGIEVYEGKPIFYSLGNFLFGSINEDIRDNIVVSIKFSKNRINSISVYPINGNTNKQNHFQPKRFIGPKADILLEHLIKISKPLKSDFPGKAVLRNSTLVYHFSPDDGSTLGIIKNPPRE